MERFVRTTRAVRWLVVFALTLGLSPRLGGAAHAEVDPLASFGNSTGDRQMLEYTKAGDWARLSVLVLHDDARRENAYGPAQGLPDTKLDTFPQALYDEAKAKGWIVISMKNDWKLVFGFERDHRVGP